MLFMRQKLISKILISQKKDLAGKVIKDGFMKMNLNITPQALGTQLVHTLSAMDIRILLIKIL